MALFDLRNRPHLVGQGLIVVDHMVSGIRLHTPLSILRM